MSKITAANYESSLAWMISKLSEVGRPEIQEDRKTKLISNIEIMRKELQRYLAAEVAKDDEAWRSIRIKKAVEIEHPLMTVEKRAELMLEYDLIDEAILSFQRAEHCKTYPGVRAIYEQLGWLVAEEKPEPRDTSTPNVTENSGTVKKSNAESQNEEPAPVDDGIEGATWF